MANNFFLTGPPRRGKSTLIIDFIPKLKGSIGGFVVQRMLLSGKTVGFRLADLGEEPYRLTQPLQGRIPDLVIYQKENSSRWTPVLSTFNQKGVQALKKASNCSLIIMDELGIFEEEAVRFQQAVLERLNSPQPVLGVLKNKFSPFLNRVRATPGLEIHRIEEKETASRLEDFLRERGLLAQ